MSSVRKVFCDIFRMFDKSIHFCLKQTTNFTNSEGSMKLVTYYSYPVINKYLNRTDIDCKSVKPLVVNSPENSDRIVRIAYYERLISH